MAESLKVNTDLMRRAAAEQRKDTAELQGPLAAQASIEAEAAGRGPIFYELKEAVLAATLPARQARIQDDIAAGERFADETEKWAGNFDAQEQANAARQGAVRL
ncbi:type VII secretion target [Mycobacteroides salmoniphilum]|uniref:hypothetical protein n=1 Tax=Mycobacteroides salmoniphilum TaxID=404941 RepID=UPI003567C722